MQKKDPILIHVPHAATYIPKEEVQYFVTPNLERELMVMTDHFTDDLFDADCEMLRFPISRLVCDPERFRDDEKEIMNYIISLASIGAKTVQVALQD